MIDFKNLHETGSWLFDEKHQTTYVITKIFSEQKTYHLRIIYLHSLVGNKKQQFTEDYLIKLIATKQIKIVSDGE